MKDKYVKRYTKLSRRDRHLFFDDVMSIYGYNFFSDHKHYDFVKQFYVKHGDKNNTLLIINKHDSVSEIKKSLVYRYSVFFGRNQGNVEKIKNILGYNPSLKSKQVDTSIRYAIVGKVKTMNYKEMYVIHTWGINFETKETDDYKRFTHKGRLNETLYAKGIRNMFRLIIKGALATCKDKINLRIPLIGMGEYLNSLSSKDAGRAKHIYYEQISQVPLHKRLKITIVEYSCDFKTERFSNGITKEYGDLFDLSHIKGSGAICLVNAWDSRSFIGNGGSKDPTIDGMMVAGIKSGKMIKNTSYLHNVFMSPSLLNTDNWRPI